MIASLRKPFMAALAVLALGLALYLPGIRAIPVTDRDEARYAQATRQMVESGDYLNIRFLDTARNKKPAGIYWLQSVYVQLTGVPEAIWPYRLAAVTGALAAVLLIGLLARRLQPDAAATGAAILAACPLLVIVAHAATTDAVVLATVCAAQFCLALVYLDARIPGSGFRVPDSGFRASDSGFRTPDSALPAALGFWAALGIGILVKGPITPLISGLTVLALCLHDRDARWLRGLRPLPGVLLLLLMVVPWLLAIQRATGGAFLQEAVGRDFLGKLQGGQESHGAPPGAYLLTAPLLFWPLFPLAVRGIRSAWLARRADPSAAFLLAWLLPAWLVFECAPTKLPHYVLPLYPALALLSCRASAAVAPAGRAWRVIFGLADAAWWFAAALLTIGPPLAAILLGERALPWACWCALIASASAMLLWRNSRAAAPSAGIVRRQAVLAAGFALLYFVPLCAFVWPRLDDLWLTRRVATMVAAHEKTSGRKGPVISLGYEEPSMAFAFGSGTRLGGGAAAAVAALRHNADTIVLVQDAPAPWPQRLPMPAALWTRLADSLTVPPKGRKEALFLQVATAAGLPVRTVASVEGFNYSKTRRVRVTLYVFGEKTP